MDERLRALERRWQETGTVEDEAALLRERLRTGDLSEAHLRLAAALGSEAAATVFPPRDPLVDLAAPWDRLVVLEDERLKQEAIVRAIVALLRRAGDVGAVSEAHARARRAVVDGFAAGVRNPRLAEALERHLVPALYPETVDPSTSAVQMVRWLRQEHGLEAAVRDFAYELEEITGVDHPTQVETVQAALVPWLLGYGDPLA